MTGPVPCPQGAERTLAGPTALSAALQGNRACWEMLLWESRGDRKCQDLFLCSEPSRSRGRWEQTGSVSETT